MPLPHMHDPNVQADWQYWENEVQPLLEGKQVELLGQLGGKDKDDLLRDAAALLFPIRWPEPFGLVMIEALACGTPVLALREGSVPEVVEDGVTGFIRDTEDELVDAVARIAELDRAALPSRRRAALLARGHDRRLRARRIARLHRGAPCFNHPGR